MIEPKESLVWFTLPFPLSHEAYEAVGDALLRVSIDPLTPHMVFVLSSDASLGEGMPHTGWAIVHQQIVSVQEGDVLLLVAEWVL